MSNLTFQYFVSPYEVYELVFTDPVVTSNPNVPLIFHKSENSFEGGD